MEIEKNDDKKNWSDIEKSLIELYKECKNEFEINELISQKNDLQVIFAEFLNKKITPSDLNEIHTKSNNDKLNLNTFSQFSNDVFQSKTIEFPFNDIVGYYNLFNFNIFNLNYTFIADNYFSMSLDTFNPRVFPNADRNFAYYSGERNTVLSSYLQSNIFHPHGNIGIPSSLLLGIHDIDQLNPNTIANSKRYRDKYMTQQKFSKEFLAQDEVKFGKIMDHGELFIIFGSSLGETDRWWWKKILNRMSDEIPIKNLYDVKHIECLYTKDKKNEIYLPTVIIYNYISESTFKDQSERTKSEEELKDKFLEYAETQSLTRIRKNIFVVSFYDSNELTAFASLNRGNIKIK